MDEEPDGVTAELLDRHLLSMTADHRRFLGHMVYGKKVCGQADVQAQAVEH